MINAKNAKELRRGIRGAFKLDAIPRGQAEDYDEKHRLKRMHPRSLYQRAKKGLHMSGRTINRGVV